MVFQKILILLLLQLIVVLTETLPGLDYLKSGYDGLQILNDQLGQSKYSIFDFSSSSSFGGESDFELNGKIYKVPFVVQATQQSLRKQTECQDMFTSFSAFIRKYAESISFSMTIVTEDLIPSLQANQQLYQIHEEITKKGKSIGMAHSYWAMYSLTTAPAFLMPLNPMFKQSLEALNRMAKTPSTDTHQSLYNQVISSFGTHYVSSVLMGGSAKIFTAVNTSYLKTLDYQAVKSEMHLTMNSVVVSLTTGFDSILIEERPSETFSNNSNNYLAFSPEVDHLNDPKAWATWESQVPNHPQPVNTTVSFISDLAFEYPEVQTHLKKTIEFYLKNGRHPTLSEVSNYQSVYQQKEGSSNSFIPGTDIVGCGFDSTSLQEKRCIFQYEGTTHEWSNPNDPSITFKVPDELFVMNKPESMSVNGTMIFNNFDNVVKNTFWENSQDRDGYMGFGSAHQKTQFTEYYRRLYTSHQSLAISLRQITWYTLKIPVFPRPPLNSVFQLSIKMLPKTFNEETSQFFQQFIAAFGTHVVVESDFGGLVFAEDWFDTCLYSFYDETWLRQELTVRHDPFGWFSSSTSTTSTTQTTHRDFDAHSESHVQLVGGTESVPLDQWAQWVPTIKYNPKPINRKLVLLSHFLENGPQKEALEQAILAYRQESVTSQKQYISELQQLSPPKTECNIDTNKTQTKRFLPQKLKLKASNFYQEALAVLCPFPGFHGTYCSGQMPEKKFYQEQSPYKFPLMPQGIGISFDIITGELKLPAVELTYQQNPSDEQIWNDFSTNFKFIIADETSVENVDSQPNIKVFKSEQEFANVWLDATERGQWLGGQYSTSKDLLDVFNKFFKGGQYTSISQLTRNVIRLSFKSDNLKLNRFAQSALDSLPRDLIPEIYNDFLDYWGTHISMETELGGMIEKQTVIQTCLTTYSVETGGMSPEKIEQALRNELNGDPNDPLFVSRRKISTDHRFGGNPEDSTDWESTIIQNPALLKINRFVSWDTLTNDDQIQANLQFLIQQRVDQMKQKQASYDQYIREVKNLEARQPIKVSDICHHSSNMAQIQILRPPSFECGCPPTV